MPEHDTSSPERLISNDSLEQARAEKFAELKENLKDTDPSDRAERSAEEARGVINRQEPKPGPKPEVPSHQEHSQSRPAAFINHHLNYTQTVASMQRKLAPASRKFSQFIHAPAVEKTSEILETTVARPSVLLGTTWTALIVGTVFYLVARHYGYALSGSELLFSFIVGALLGLVIEGASHVLGRKKRY